MLVKNEAALLSLVQIPENSFATDPFVSNPDVFLKELSDELQIDASELKKIYRFVPESFITSTIAQAVSFYLNQIELKKPAAFFVPKSLYRFKNKLASYALMLDTCSMVVEEISGEKTVQIDEENLDNFNGSAILVEDAMYSGRELIFYIHILFTECRYIESVALFLAAATQSSLRSLPPETDLYIASLTPLIQEVVPQSTANQLTTYFHTNNTFVVTAHKLPDTMSFHEQARKIIKGKEDISLYPNAALRNYPTVTELSKKVLALFA